MLVLKRSLKERTFVGGLTITVVSIDSKRGIARLDLDGEVYSFHERETLAIGEGISLYMAAVRLHYIRLGVQAPPDVRVMREEAITSN